MLWSYLPGHAQRKPCDQRRACDRCTPPYRRKAWDRRRPRWCGSRGRGGARPAHGCSRRWRKRRCHTIGTGPAQAMGSGRRRSWDHTQAMGPAHVMGMRGLRRPEGPRSPPGDRQGTMGQRTPWDPARSTGGADHAEGAGHRIGATMRPSDTCGTRTHIATP